MKIFYFTATGNSLYVAKRVGGELGELYSIPQMIKEGEHEFEDESIGFIFPSNGFGMSRLVSDFIKASKFKANYFFSIMTYGNTPASGLEYMEQIGRAVGIQFNYTNELLMIDNYLPNFEMEDQLREESSKKIEEKLNQIIMDVTNRRNMLTRKGLGWNILTKFGHGLSVKLSYNTSHKRFIVQDNCNSCKVCEKVCPANNIKVVKKPEFAHKCVACFACIHHCPQNAIDIKSQKSKARFINQNVRLNEIIGANNQNRLI
ncbi:EFR1 family ferrodoxin [Desulfosporosinus fructosivorans]